MKKKIKYKNWLSELGLEQYTSIFENGNFQWKEIIQLKKEELMNFGITDDLDLKKIEFEQKHIRQELINDLTYGQIFGILISLALLSFLYYLVSIQVLPEIILTLSKINIGIYLLILIYIIVVTPKIIKEFPISKTYEKIGWLGGLFALMIMINILIVLIIIGIDKYENKDISFILKDIGIKFFFFFLGSIAIALIGIEIDKGKYLNKFEAKN